MIWLYRLNELANYVWALAPGSRTPLGNREIKLVAHRGVHGPGGSGTVIENTLDAFSLCQQVGAWGIEFDIRLTRDNEPVVNHDPHLGRLFKRPDIVIAETPFDALRKAVPQVPHLDEVVTRYAGKLHLMIEIKESWRQRPALPARVAHSLASLAPGRDYHLMSLVPDHLESFSAVPRDAFIDIARTNLRDILKQNLELGHGALAGSFALIGPGSLQQLHAAGRRVGTGIVKNRRVLNREVQRGVEWIFTDAVVPLLDSGVVATNTMQGDDSSK
ncbi:glycerophosphodiester phosphodiesterase [Natronospirillum operosum]|uniref:Glycerophosphodiester phosphodiesterase n=1 Tax=Natronospirillum operosum TaxID=2759953 RepID=A0A4Z0W5D6_9GAMM|nr:glycerophosphodiester phosphodiesterase family protein [Natronospirillum operosum]TGG92862.1 glycerophosphodiester phosphodiesterase [Natronospirillum operosum]